MSDTLIVTLAILAFFLILLVVSILRLRPSTFLKFWAALGPIFGGLVGTIGTYYFQKDQVNDAEQLTARLARAVAEVNQEHEQLGAQLAGLQTQLRTPGTANPEVAAVAKELGTVQEKFEVQGGRLNAALKAVPKALLSAKPESTPKGASPLEVSEEREPNNEIIEANPINEGTIVRGSIASGQDRDVFVFRNSRRTPHRTRVILRKLTPESFWASVTIVDHAEQFVAHDSDSGRTSLAFESLPNSRYYVWVAASEQQRGSYELEVREELPP